MKRALISVSDKAHVVDFARRLTQLGWEIISTGGTSKTLNDNGVATIDISSITGFPECMDGRVKTLHPNIHGGLLARRSLEKHMKQADELHIEMIDMVVVNLYPFKETLTKAGSTHEDIIENIDIGGPSMLRSAAKNFEDVLVLCDPADYEGIIEKLESHEDFTIDQRAALALKVFEHTSHYDALIAAYLRTHTGVDGLGKTLTMTFELGQTLRYGENPHQEAWFYKEPVFADKSMSNYNQIHGKELSFNNLNDLSAAVQMVREFRTPAAIAVKHTNPCGAATAHDLPSAYNLAYEADPQSIFGGIVAVNREVDKETAENMNKVFLEIIAAPKFSAEALDILTKKKNIRLLEIPTGELYKDSYDLKKVEGGILIQSTDVETEGADSYKVVTERIPTEQEMKDLQFGWKICKHVKSNAIVLAKNDVTTGIGPGQTSRVWALENAIKQAGASAKGSVVASDAFFPFADSIEAAAAAGISAIIQPGGSVNDKEVIEAANKYGIAMIFTGVRHFKH